MAKVPSKAAAVIRRALPELASASLAKRQRGVDALADLIDLHRVPQVHASTVPVVQPRPTGPVACPPVGQQQTHERIENQEAIDLYLLGHAKCEVRSCQKPATVVHHLKPAGNGGDDVPQNFIAPCGGKYNHDGSLAVPDPDNHHTGNLGRHPLGGRRWYARFKPQLSAGARRKIERVLRLDPEEEVQSGELAELAARP